MDIRVELLPALMEPRHLAGRTAVVVDILRATTTITAALAAGARGIVPSPSVAAARETHQRLGADAVLGGERAGKKVDGFHYGNSPREYSSDIIADRILVLATTNGTVAMERCRAADEILIGSFVNISAIVQQLRSVRKITILCSGTDQKITGEDVLFAGALCERLQQNSPNTAMNDVTRLALGYWIDTKQRIENGGTSLAETFSNCLGGRNLARIGYHADIEFCAKFDTYESVGKLDIQDWQIRKLAAIVEK